MDERAKLIVFCNNYLGGVANFYRNILTNDTEDIFQKKTIFIQWESLSADYTLLPSHFETGEEIVFEIKKDKKAKQVSKEIAALIGDFKGVIVTNFAPELSALHFYKKPGARVVFICHDEFYLDAALQFSFLIDRYIAHNFYFYEELKRRLPERENDIFLLPYGISIPVFRKEYHSERNLKVVWLARLNDKKGIYEVPVIDDYLKSRNVCVEWTIIGDGPERDSFRKLVAGRSNFTHYTPADNDAVQQLLVDQDVFILPSRLDGLPLAMLETMSMGIVPVMFEFNPGIKRAIGEDAGFVVSLNDTTAMAEKISELHNDRAMLQRMSANARRKVEEDYDIKKQAKKYFTLFAGTPVSASKSAWVPIWKLHGKEYHPFIPSWAMKLYMSARSKFKK